MDVRTDSRADPVEITVGRLHLRPWLPADADAVYAACQDPQIQRWTSVPSPYTHRDAREYVEVIAPREWAAGAGTPFAVVDATTGDLLASVGLRLLDAGNGVAEVGYWCALAARGRGVTTQAVGVVCRWGFAARDLGRVEWYAQVGNVASRRVAERAGFTVEGTARGRILRRGERVDAWAGGLLATDPLR